MAGGLAGGYILGHQLAPKGDNRNLHGLLVGSTASAMVGAGMIYFLNEDESLKKKNEKIIKLRNQLETKNKQLLKSGSINNLSLNNDKMPKEITNLINPGSWKLYKVDEWERKSENVLIHNDKELVFEAPKIKEEE
jgi:glutamate synthase domain-containing protein 3